MLTTLNKTAFCGVEKAGFEDMSASPVTILQIGEGNFIRGFFDWMIHQCRKQGLYQGSIAVTQPRPTGKPKIEALASQDGLYTLVIRGLENGRQVEHREIVPVFSEVFDCYSEWERLVQLAISPDLQFVVSNTTEAGLSYRPEELEEGRPIVSFPGKITYLLYRRYIQYSGAANRGLIFLPCELLERNGDALQTAVLQYAGDWGLPAAFVEWVLAHNRFLNSLVDRIVTGYPDQKQAEEWFAEWGYRDELLSTAEPYHLWAIEAEPELDDRLPFRQAGLNVHWVADLTPYQQRKVRILNGAHTLMTPLGIIHGIEHVRELMAHDRWGSFVRSAIQEDIIPTLPYPSGEMKAYADTVFERYSNPYIRHRLADIAMNSISKFKTRLIPSLAYYADREEPIPPRLALGFAGLIRYCRVKSNGEQYEGVTLSGQVYVVRDDENILGALASIWENAADSKQPLHETISRIVADETIWGRDLFGWKELTESIVQHLDEWDRGKLQ